MLTKIRTSFINNTFASNTRLKLAKQHTEAELLLLENCMVSSSTLSSKDNKKYSKKCAKTKYVYLNDDIWLMAQKMRLKMKNRSSRYNINRPRRWHGHRYPKYKICLDIMMVISIRQHLSYIWSLIHEKVKQYWPRRHRASWTSSERLMYVQFTSCVYGGGWFKKTCTSSLAKFSVFPFLITMLFFEINTSVEVLP